MKHVLPLLLLAAMSMSYGIAQYDIPGQEAFESIFGTSVELDLEKCCLAAYGWHNAKEIKFEGVSVESLKSNNVKEELLKSNIFPTLEEQYFYVPDGRIIVVMSRHQFEKVYGRFIINLNAKQE